MLAMIQEESSLIRIMRKRQRKLIGYMFRRDLLLRMVIKGKIEGKGKRKT